MRIGYGISVAGSNQRNLVSAQAEQVIWKVAIFGAGATSSNGEYAWDGTTTFNGENVYSGPADNQIAFVDGLWYLYDSSGGDDTYTSENLIAWDILAGLSPVPSSAFSYAQDSEIQSITLSDAGTTSSDGTYTWDGINVINGEPVYESGANQISYGDFGNGYNEWGLYDDTAGDNVYLSNDRITWSVFNGSSPAPSVSAVVYSA